MNTPLLAFLLALPFLVAVAALAGAWRKRRRQMRRPSFTRTFDPLKGEAP